MYVQRLSRLRPIQPNAQHIIRTGLSFSNRSSILSALCQWVQHWQALWIRRQQGPIQHATSSSFASGIMKIQLRFGLCHTIVLDKDSKFFGVCKEAIDLLQIYRHVLSGGNHNGMLVKCINRYLNKGLKIMTCQSCYGSDLAPPLCMERHSNSRYRSLLMLCCSWL